MTFSVHDQGGFARTYNEDETVIVRKGTLRGLLDIASNSLDWGSGWLDNEQVELLREAAVLVGVDTATVTPANMVCQYEYDNEHDRRVLPDGWSDCRRCGKLL